jgi:cytochrome P450
MESPDCERKLQIEVDSMLGGRLPSFEDIPRLEYTGRVVKEAMRIFPPIWGIARHSLGEFCAGGYRIPAGCEVLISQWVMHHSSRYFEDPLRFNPDRWTDEFTANLPKFVYLPFSAGPRNCIGSGFAMMESVLILATMTQAISMRRVSTSSIIPFPSITLRPKGDLTIRPLKRKGISSSKINNCEN